MYVSVILLIFGIFMYIFMPRFRRGINDLIAAIGYWLSHNLHVPTWLMTIGRWIWQRFRSGLLFIMAMLVVLSGLWMYAYKTGNTQVLLVAMAITGILLMVVAIFSQIIQGLGSWFGLETKTGGFGKMAISIILWIMVNFAMLSIPNNWYFNNLWVPIVVTALLLAFMLKGWYNNEMPKYTPETFIIIFIGFLVISGYINWEAGKIRLPGWLQNKANEIRLEKEVDGQMLLASFVQPSVAYQYDKKNKKYEPAPKIKYHPGSTVLVSKPNTPPDASQGESMLEVIRQNEYGDFFGTGVWVPARKLEYLSPSELREKQKQKQKNEVKIDTVAALVKKNQIWWALPQGSKFWVVLPPNSEITFETTQYRGTEPMLFVNQTGKQKKVGWYPRYRTYFIKKIKIKKGSEILILRKTKGGK